MYRGFYDLLHIVCGKRPHCRTSAHAGTSRRNIYSERADVISARATPTTRVPNGLYCGYGWRSKRRRSNIQGSLEEGLPSAWIGDAEAFAAYQANYHTTLTRRQTSPYLEERFRIAGAMSGALDAVVNDSSIESVGDFTVSVMSQPAQGDGFRYLSHASGSGFKPVANTTEETSLTQSLGVEGGSYHYCILVPTAAGVGALAVHIREARVGILFFPARSWTSNCSKVSIQGPSFMRFALALESLSMGFESELGDSLNLRRFLRSLVILNRQPGDVRPIS